MFSTQIQMFKLWSPESRNVASFGDRVAEGVISEDEVMPGRELGGPLMRHKGIP